MKSIRKSTVWMLLSLMAPPIVTCAADKKADKDPAKLDRSGKPRKGEASYYGKKFHHKETADGSKLDPKSNMAASKTLPLGTKAKVTNLESGKSAVVEIADRGPYVDGRIIDVTPKVAEKLDMKDDGTAPVVVKPIELPKDAPAKDKDDKK
jgi:rare lipoprotein A